MSQVSASPVSSNITSTFSFPIRMTHVGDPPKHSCRLVILNLERCQDRLERMHKQMERMNITSYSIAHAIDGQRLNPIPQLYELVKYNKYGSRRGTMACALSHMLILNALVQDKQAEQYFILEDDVEFHPMFADAWQEIVDSTKQDDICFAGFSFVQKRDVSYQVRMLDDTKKPVRTPFSYENYLGGAFAMIVSKQGARKILDNIFRETLAYPIDKPNIYMNNCTITQLEPFAVATEVTFSNKLIHRPLFSSNVQNNQTIIDFDKTFPMRFDHVLQQFEFFPQSDIVGLESFHQTMLIPDLLRRALSHASIQAVTTSGSFKYALAPLTYIPSELTEGVYIKKQFLLSPERPLIPIQKRIYMGPSNFVSKIILIQYSSDESKIQTIADIFESQGFPNITRLKMSTWEEAQTWSIRLPLTSQDPLKRRIDLMRKHTLMRALLQVRDESLKRVLVITDEVLMKQDVPRLIVPFVENICHTQPLWDMFYFAFDERLDNQGNLCKRQSIANQSAFCISNRSIDLILDAFSRHRQTSAEETMARLVHPLINVYSIKLMHTEPIRSFLHQDTLPSTGTDKKVRVKIIYPWDNPVSFTTSWYEHCQVDTIYEDIQLIFDDQDVDYSCIINYPPEGATFDKSKTLVFTMEPQAHGMQVGHAVNQWKEWSRPDPSVFFHVHSHDRHLNNVNWIITIPTLFPMTRFDRVLCIVSDKYEFVGHKLRIEFCKHLNRVDWLDSFGRSNGHGLKSYRGPLEFDKKETQMVRYKYYLSCENNSEHNYATEKIWEPILCESLCFYWGCPNLGDHIDERAFVTLPLDDFDKAQAMIEQAIREDWHSQRIEYIRQAKRDIVTRLGFMPTLQRLLHPQEDLKTIQQTTREVANDSIDDKMRAK